MFIASGSGGSISRTLSWVQAMFTAEELVDRLRNHFVAWFDVGMGLSFDQLSLILGGSLVAGGFVLYLVRSPTRDRDFWRQNLPWALLHVAITFCFLPFDQRYYLPVFPLLLAPVVLGFARLPFPWNILRLAVPALFLWISVPLALDKHRVEPPPVRLLRFLQEQHPGDGLGQVRFLTRSGRRHAEWYAPGLAVALPGESGDREHFRFLYTDDTELAKKERGLPLATFWRSNLINPKHTEVTLYLLSRPAGREPAVD